MNADERKCCIRVYLRSLAARDKIVRLLLSVVLRGPVQSVKDLALGGRHETLPVVALPSGLGSVTLSNISQSRVDAAIEPRN
jgi:hypothetical protein